MAYQNVSTPRFYVSILQWLKSLGMASYYTGADFTPLGDASSLLEINPSSTITFKPTGSGSYDNMSFQTDMPLGTIMPPSQNFFMVLGHNFRSAEVSDLIVRNNDPSDEVCPEGVVNEISGGAHNGFTIMKGDDADNIAGDYLVFTFDGVDASTPDIKIGSLLYGNYYNMPVSPNLNLTLTREYGGVDELTTIDGSTISNATWTSPPKWGNLPQWTQRDSPNPLFNFATGRRVWNLSFSYMSDSDVWSSNESLSNWSGDWAPENGEDYSGYYKPMYTYEGYEGANESGGDIRWVNTTLPGDWNLGFNYNLLTDDSFYSQVWHKTLGGTLPFIFQADKDNNNVDQFAICKFRDNSLKVTQTAFNVYDISLIIEEVW